MGCGFEVVVLVVLAFTTGPGAARPVRGTRRCESSLDLDGAQGGAAGRPGPCHGLRTQHRELAWPAVASPLLGMSTLVVEQRRKMFELRNQYRIFDESGDVAGTVEQVDQSAFAVLARFGTDLDVALPMTLEVKDAGDARVLRLEKPRFTRRFTVSRPDGTLVGSIAKQFRVGKARFTINDSIGTEMGEVRA